MSSRHKQWLRARAEDADRRVTSLSSKVQHQRGCKAFTAPDFREIPVCPTLADVADHLLVVVIDCPARFEAWNTVTKDGGF